MKKYEIAYHNYAEAKRAHQVQFIQTCAFGQNNRVRSKQYYQWYFHIYEAQKKVQSPVKQFKKLFNLSPNHRPLFRSQIFSVAECYDVQGSHLIGYLWVSLIIEQSECMVCYFLCTELTLLSIELFENCIYLNCVLFSRMLL